MIPDSQSFDYSCDRNSSTTPLCVVVYSPSSSLATFDSVSMVLQCPRFGAGRFLKPPEEGFPHPTLNPRKKPRSCPMMSRFLPYPARYRLPLLLKTLSHSCLTPIFSRAFIAEPRPSAFDENLLRILRSEIAYLADYRPPLPAPATFKSFSVEDRPGEQWIWLRSTHSGEPREDIKVDATMFDGAAPIPTSSISKKVEALEQGPRLHISLVVEVSRGDDCGSVLAFICSAWPDSLHIQKVFPLRRKGAVLQPYRGHDFKELDKGMQSAVQEYLEDRGVDDEFAEFLHEYMMNKDKVELLRWLRIVEAYVQK